MSICVLHPDWPWCRCYRVDAMTEAERDAAHQHVLDRALCPPPTLEEIRMFNAHHEARKNEVLDAIARETTVEGRVRAAMTVMTAHAKADFDHLVSGIDAIAHVIATGAK